MPVMLTAMTAWSDARFWRSAAQPPAVTPTSSASSMAQAPSCRDTGKPSRISSVTVRSMYWNDGPKSPRLRPHR